MEQNSRSVSILGLMAAAIVAGASLMIGWIAYAEGRLGCIGADWEVVDYEGENVRVLVPASRFRKDPVTVRIRNFGWQSVKVRSGAGDEWEEHSLHVGQTITLIGHAIEVVFDPDSIYIGPGASNVREACGTYEHI